MKGIITVQNITKVRDGLWLIVYIHTCDCGCTSKRYNFNYSSKNQPTNTKAKQLADADYIQR